MPAITIPDLNRAKQDVDHIAEVANSTGLTATDRLGNVKPTVRGAVNTLAAFNARGAFTGATAYALKDVYTSAGIAYVAVVAHVSTSVAVDLAAGKVTIHQGATREDLAASEGSGLVGNGYGASPGGISLPVNPLTVFTRSSPIPLKSVVTGGAMVTDASVNYSTQLQSVINYLRDYGGGKIILPPNTRIWAAGISLYTGIEIEGYEWSTVIEVPGNQIGIYVNPGTGGTTSIADNQRNIALRNFKIKGAVTVAGFAEHNHLVGFSAVSYSEIVGMCIEGFQGDGINFGSGYVGGLERHNYRNRVIGGRIDGVNNDNRNGISIIDSNGMEIDGVEFRNCTRANMPGAIDMEPDGFAYPIMKNIAVRNCTFDNCGGNVGMIGVIHPAAAVADVENLTIENNTAKNGIHSSAFIAFNTYRAPTEASAPNNVRILNNKATGGPSSMTLYSGKGILAAGNVFTDHAYGMLLGYVESANAVRDVTLTDNRFVRQASSGGSGLNIFRADRLDLTRNKFIDCGSGVPASANGINFQTGASSYVSFDANEISAPTGKTLIGIQREPGHVMTPSTNKFYKGELNGLANFFLAEDSDTLERDFVPVVTGSSSAGAGTYTLQYGVYKRIGKTVFFRLKLIVAAGHTGTGMIQINLPVSAAGSSLNQERAISLVVDGASTTGGHIGLINPAVNIGGILGAIRCYFNGTGAMQQMLMPVGAFTVYVSGNYQAA